MPATYTDCPLEVETLIDTWMRKQHPKLIEAGVTVNCLFHRSDNGLMFQGYPAAAVMKINSLKDRVEGKSDATLTICESWWNDASEEEKDAVIDHELLHLTVATNQAGAIDYDDVNRPKLRLRKHDFYTGGFFEIAQRHGVAAPEVQNIMNAETKFRQMELNFA